MKRFLMLMAVAAALGLTTGCETPIPPGAERGPHGTIAYFVPVDATPPGAHIEGNGEYAARTPVTLKIWGDPDGTFHDFGSSYYFVRALPVTTNQFPQTRVFYTGHMLGPEDRIPSRIFFDMNTQPPQYVPVPVPYPAYPSPYYYDPFWGPSVHFGVPGPRFHRRWR